MTIIRRSMISLALAGLLPLAVAAGSLSAQDTTGAPQHVRQIQITILGMSCPFCAYGVEQKLKKLDGVDMLKVNLATGLATLTMKEGADIQNEKLVQVVKDAGFKAARITRTFESRYPSYPEAGGG